MAHGRTGVQNIEDKNIDLLLEQFSTTVDNVIVGPKNIYIGCSCFIFYIAGNFQG